MNSKITVCLSIIAGLVCCSTAFATVEANLEVLSVTAANPELISQEVCDGWFDQGITINSPLQPGEEPEDYDSGSLYLNEEDGAYSFSINGEVTDIMYANLAHEEVSDLETPSGFDDLDEIITRINFPVAVVLPYEDSEDGSKIGFVQMMSCVALVKERD